MTIELGYGIKGLGNQDVTSRSISTRICHLWLSPQEASLVDGASQGEFFLLIAYLIDSVAGQILHHVMHPSMMT